MEKTQKLLTRLARMSPGIFGLIIIALAAAGYHRSALMMLVLGGSTIGTVTVLVAVVLFAIREKPISVLKPRGGALAVSGVSAVSKNQ